MNNIVAREDEGLRLDKWLASRFPFYSRHYFQNLIIRELVLVNGKQVKKSLQLSEGDEIEVEFVLSPEMRVEAQPMSFEILYEDDHILAINKPAGLVVHPAVGNWTNTFVNGLVHYCNLKVDKTLRPGIVHRLDKDTSGVLIAAKTEHIQGKLVTLFAERKIEKTYIAVCLGKPCDQIIENQIGRHPKKRQQMAVVAEGGKTARTLCNTIASRDQLSLVKLIPETGRTHQLRVHLQSIGCPILGDPIYGNLSFNYKLKTKRQLLHALSLRFEHPLTQASIELKAPIPEDLHNFIQKFGNCNF